MKKFIQVCFLIVIVLLGRTPVALSQASVDDFIRNIKLISIRDMQVVCEGDRYYLYISVELQNDNDRSVLLTRNNFRFSLCWTHKYSECRSKNPQFVTTIGDDLRYINEEIELEQRSSKDVKFKVNLGSGYVVADSMAAIINFAGDFQIDKALFIEGRFDLGIKTEYGWTFVETIRVAWQFCPEVRDHIPVSLSF